MAISVATITGDQVNKLLTLEEGHFNDFKSRDIQPAKLTKALAAFANADGGDLMIGIAEVSGSRVHRWEGFTKQEAANGHIQAFETLFPLGQEFSYEFLSCSEFPGLVLHIAVRKSASIKKASDGVVYVRRGAQSLPLKDDEQIRRLQYAKGILSFETEPTQSPATVITNSTEIIEFMLDVIPSAEPDAWLRKQQLLRDDKPTVCGVLLFADEPQAIIPKHCGIKVYRYKTTDKLPTRDTLAFDPQTIEGCAYKQIHEAVNRTVKIVEDSSALGSTGLESVSYPHETVHEIVTNAVIHRDYSIADDIHIRIFDNRIEIESPGKLPAHITPENILEERYARNGNLVRLLNRYPIPPNKDVGEGLNTAFHAMRKLGLKAPIIENRNSTVLVTIRHERLASREEIILEYLESNDSIANKKAREICFVDADYKMRRTFQKLEERELIAKVPGTNQASTAYEKGSAFGGWRTKYKPEPHVDDDSPEA
jgi:ATP-dependent DNA helicase RecG